MNNARVYLGMSGGVDSSVTALLLKEAGFDVTGVFIQGWYPDFLKCNWKDERRDAMRVAAQLEIPFLTINVEDAYKKEVIDYMVREYSRGRTPNPDVMCNRHVKFGAFLNEALKQDADFIATGHYAQIENGALESNVVLKSAVDSDKDQTYFLWNVPKLALSQTLFPIGDLHKSEVRDIARKNNLITAEKKDSQGVCFLGKVSMKDFLKHSIKTEKGDVLDSEGSVIGYHDGALLYTLGERKGFTIVKKGTDDAPRYVIDKDIEKNTLTVSEKNDASFQARSKHETTITDTNWISREPKEGEVLMARFRHRQDLRLVQVSKITVKKDTKEDAWAITFTEAEEAVSPGQSLVLYAGDVCLGGGIIV